MRLLIPAVVEMLGSAHLACIVRPRQFPLKGSLALQALNAPSDWLVSLLFLELEYILNPGHLRRQGFSVLDAQIQNSHIATLGVYEISQAEFQSLLQAALPQDATF